ncbi:protein Abitram [Halyomorpha halys]|uniref:protein Abitram n=1 Tax=Halyomorpha halys TaxID=286706 RepID=UPI0006D4F4A5|nr:protein Simiate [Halyomorpha halys]
MDFKSLPIDYDLNESDKYSSVVQRYYTPRYCMNITQPGDDYCILIHSNRVCLITLAPSHALFKNKDISSVSFQISHNLNRLKNKVSGKSKHGAQRLQPSSTIMLVNCADGNTYSAKCGISGKLLEVNEQLLQNPNLLVNEPQGRGYIAIVLPDIALVQQYKDSLLDELQYQEKCKILDS